MLLPLLVATFLLSRTIVRHPVVINVCCSWIMAGIVSSLLYVRLFSVEPCSMGRGVSEHILRSLYARQETGPEPDKGLCIVQSVLISPVPPM